MTNIYKLTKKREWLYFYKILINTLLIYFAVFAVYIYVKEIKNSLLIIKLFLGMLFFGWFLIFGLPLFLLYFNHIKYSKSVKIKYENDIMTYENSNESITFSVDDIEKIELWLTPPAYDNRIDWQFFGKYHFTRIYTKQNQLINISCIVFDETEELFE